MIGERRKVLSAILVTLTGALLLTMSMSVAYATPPTIISGQIIITGATIYDTRQAGNSDNVLVNLSLRTRFTGGISGSSTSESRWVRHDVGSPDPWTNAHGVNTISPATVMGKTGTLLWMLNGITPEGGTWVIISGTGDLANLHGQGTWSPSANPNVMNYEGQVHFDP